MVLFVTLEQRSRFISATWQEYHIQNCVSTTIFKKCKFFLCFLAKYTNTTPCVYKLCPFLLILTHFFGLFIIFFI